MKGMVETFMDSIGISRDDYIIKGGKIYIYSPLADLLVKKRKKDWEKSWLKAANKATEDELLDTGGAIG